MSSLRPKVSGPSEDMPHSQTILRAMEVAFSKSLPAPVVSMSEEGLLGDASGQQHRQLGVQVGLGVGVFVVERQLLGHAQGHAARE